MKSIKSKRNTNSSFLSNHDLLENFRNKSFKLITRDASISQFKQIPKKVTLIQKKSYQNILQDTKQNHNKQNDPGLTNRKKSAIQSKGTTFRQSSTIPQIQTQITKIIKELNFIYDQINTQEIQLRMILNKNIRKIKQVFNVKLSTIQPFTSNITILEAENKGLRQKLQAFQIKVDEQSKKLYLLKREKEQIQDNVEIYEKRIENLQRKLKSEEKTGEANSKPKQKIADHHTQIGRFFQKNTGHHSKGTKMSDKNRENKSNSQQVINQDKFMPINKQAESEQDRIDILQKIIEEQQQLISRQIDDFSLQNQEFWRLLQCQATQLQQLMNSENNKQQQQAPSVKMEPSTNYFINSRSRKQSVDKSIERFHYYNQKHNNSIANTFSSKNKSSLQANKSSIMECKPFSFQNRSKTPVNLPDSYYFQTRKDKNKASQFSVFLY